MDEPHKHWIDQCAAAVGIREQFGLQKALGYLVGEKFANHVEFADTDPDFARELPDFVNEIKHIFSAEELHDYFLNLRGLGALAHVAASDEEYRESRDLLTRDDAVDQAKDILLARRIRALLLDTP